ncbi:hydantoinase B/oxoprolinase family protein [Roseovarius atlanticus]|uniref:hydantoinase B/oxoprolinase family protein n=1 Tax=Roseovarius atlanticus TaxID=1641875 RepID=UPI001C97907C|nr:hydantoinase B/oxoprolinase family protein [Roseovarius atlanticus]MBY5986564.1 hydantoinase B/oxoprolinase family protein [Roseovarius atlanticus]MBY6125204.1 hydantoinase B/oxoprolinase family protein [Roseovarius atlanticus]MBY6150335.1 hydantoinase B/oxoprolinase family protein [Roseovarius atlanticus]
MSEKLSPATFNIISNGLHGIAQEMGEKLVRSAYSTIIREARDCSTSFLDRNGRIIAQAQFCPIHMNSFGKVFEAFANKFDLSTIQPDEGLITNDPYSGAQHLNDIILFTPVFYRDRLVAFSASLGHHIDTGGGAAGPNASANDVYSEGLRIPLSRFNVQRDMGDGLLEQFIRINVRPPNEVMGDIYAQFSANRTGEARFIEMLERFGEETVLAGAAELQDYSERLAREAISAIPDGTYEAEDFVDDNGFTPERLRVAVKIKVDGDSLELDFEGSAPQTKGIINSPLAATVSAAFGAIGILLGGGRIPVNDGLYRPIRSINVPYGSFLNPSEPRAVRARNNACHRVYNSIMLAMSDVVPTQVLASGHDTTNAIGMGHMSPDGYRVYMEVVGGGWGASAGADGADVVDGYVGNCSNVPVESLETDYPFMRVEEYALRRGSAGAGERRGGLGARRVYRILADGVTFNSYSDRFKVAPWGLFDGQSGQHSQFTVERDGKCISLPSKGNTELIKGDRLVIETAGGGGFGDPRKRDRQVLEREIAHGLLTAEDAAEIYGLS